MSLLIGSQVTAETLGWQLTIRQTLGEGGQPIGLPPKLVMSCHSRTHTLLLSRTAKLRQRHVDPFATDDVAETILGEVTPHPTNPSIWGLRNLSSTPCVATSPDGSAKEVPPQKVSSLEAGLKLNVAGVVAEVQP